MSSSVPETVPVPGDLVAGEGRLPAAVRVVVGVLLRGQVGNRLTVHPALRGPPAVAGGELGERGRPRKVSTRLAVALMAALASGCSAE